MLEKSKHLQTIDEIKRYIRLKDYDGLKNYIELREKEIIEEPEENESSKYIDDLLKKLE